MLSMLSKKNLPLTPFALDEIHHRIEEAKQFKELNRKTSHASQLLQDSELNYFN